MTECDQPWWRTKGLLVAGGWHPLTGRLRCQIPDESLEDDYLWEYSEEHILRLKELGITLLIGQFDRGLGDSDQAEDQELARQQAELCHQHGIYHGVYLPNTLYNEWAFKDHPDCDEWVTRTAEGEKTYYGGEQTWRWVACFNSPGWRERMRRQIKKAIEVVKTDLLHFDNLGLSLAPHDCHCDYCQAGFRAFLAARYPTPESQKQRFGFTGFETFRIPVFFPHFCPPWDLDRIQTPLLQEWVWYRIATVTDYITDLTAYARSLKPDICVDSNGQAFHGNNMGLIQGRGDSEGQLASVDIMWDENPDWRPDDDPRAVERSVTKFRGMLFARRLGKLPLTGYRSAEDLAFNLTFGGHPGINPAHGYAEPGRKPLTPVDSAITALLAHHQRQLQAYCSARPACRVAVWRNQMSLAFICFDTHLSAFVLEQLLFDERIPFSIVQDGFINPEGLAQFDVLILPDVEYVSDAQAAALKQFVADGGSLLLTERTGIYSTEPPRRRRVPAFADLFGAEHAAPAGGLEETMNVDANRQHELVWEPGRTAFASHGEGRAAYIGEVDYVHRPRAFKSLYNVHYDGIDSRYWKAPYNAQEIISALEWLRPELRPVGAAGGRELHLDYLTFDGGARGVTLFRSGTAGATAADVPFWVAGEAEPQGARLVRPEQQEPVPLNWRAADRRFETVLPAVGRHALVMWDS
jgi:hypothetical protein